MKTLLTTLLTGLLLGSYAQRFSATDSVIVTSTNNYGDDCRGFDFTPINNITIFKLGKRVPNIHGTYTWVIWDVASGTKVYEQVSQDTLATQYHYEYTDSVIHLNAGTTYSMTMYCDNNSLALYYYGSSNQINSNLTFGGTRYCNVCNPSTFPTQTLSGLHYGNSDFLFVNGHHYHTSGMDVHSLCDGDSLNWMDGNTYYNDTVIATFTMENSVGLDSVINLDLSYKYINTQVDVNGLTLTSIDTNSIYQWVNCDSLYSPLQGETLQSFTTTINGNFAVILNYDGCVDTSDCKVITSVAINDLENNQFNLFPNPSNGRFNVLNHNNGFTHYAIYTIGGQLLEKNLCPGRTFELNLDLPNGIYFLELSNKNVKQTKKMIIAD